MKLFKKFPVKINININSSPLNCDECDECEEDEANPNILPIGFFLTPYNDRVTEVIEIERVIYSDKYTIVLWTNGEKTIVKAQNDEPFDKEKGLAMAIIKRLYGNTGRYNELFKEYCNE